MMSLFDSFPLVDFGITLIYQGGLLLGIAQAAPGRAPPVRAIGDHHHPAGYSLASRGLGPLSRARWLSLPPIVAPTLFPNPILPPSPVLPGVCLIFSLQTAFKINQFPFLSYLLSVRTEFRSQRPIGQDLVCNRLGVTSGHSPFVN